MSHRRDHAAEAAAEPRKSLRLEAPLDDPFPVDDLEAFLDREAPAHRWLAEGLITERGTAMVRGRRGVGKSSFVLGLSCAIASGKPFLRYEVPDPAGVLFVNAELPAADLQERLRRYTKAGLRRRRP